MVGMKKATPRVYQGKIWPKVTSPPYFMPTYPAMAMNRAESRWQMPSSF